MTPKPVIGIDIRGNDRRVLGTAAFIREAACSARLFPEVAFRMFGTSEDRTLLEAVPGGIPGNLTLLTTATSWLANGMKDIRKVSKTSGTTLHAGIEALKSVTDGIDVLVTPAPTLSLKIIGRREIGRIAGIRTEGYSTVAPCYRNGQLRELVVTELGQSTIADRDYLLSMAWLGLDLAHALGLGENVALLGIDQNASVGPPGQKELYADLKAAFDRRFIGMVQAHRLFKPSSHDKPIAVVVSDSISGNVLTKAAVGYAALSTAVSRQQPGFSGPDLTPTILNWRGALVSGWKRPVIKIRWDTDRLELAGAIRTAIRIAHLDIPSFTTRRLSGGAK